jgi:3-oxoadipate enol-lactonase
VTKQRRATAARCSLARGGLASPAMLGHDSLGAGARAVLVMNDWLCDTSTWDGARAYLDDSAFTWVFADLRGYGLSREVAGEYTVEEATADVLALADALGLRRFAIVGHSMSSLVALHLAQQRPDRIERAVVIAPPPPGGFGVDDATLDAMRALARGDDQQRLAGTRRMVGDRLSQGWVRFKAERWRKTSDPEAVAAYVTMFARRGLPDPARAIDRPLLAVTGEQDSPPMRSDAVTRSLTPLCPQLEVIPLADSGHYPMQETPPGLVAILERFLSR